MSTHKRMSNNVALTASQALERKSEETEMLAGENDLAIHLPAASGEVQ